MTITVAPTAPTLDGFSFVSREDVKAHLDLIRAFHDLRTDAEDDATWRNRVSDSVAKFRTWAGQLCTSDVLASKVDLDIIMVWHTYLLNPIKYQRDTLRLYPGLLNLDFADALAQLARGSLTPQLAPGKPATTTPIEAELADLESAVHRQASFIDKVVRLGWADKRTDEFVSNCIQRYGCFLALVKSGNVHSLVPTLDIDLAWHTHQLKGSKYCKETKELLGHVLNHDDSIPETQLSQSFGETTAAWKAQFGTTYLAKRSFEGPEAINGSAGCGGGCNGECGECGTLQRGSCAPGECGECGSRLSEIHLGAAGCGGGCNGECGSCGTRA